MVAPPRQTQQQLNQDGSGLAAANESTMKRSLTAAKSLSNLSKLVGPRVWSERERASKVGAVPVCILGLGPSKPPRANTRGTNKHRRQMPLAAWPVVQQRVRMPGNKY